MPGTPPTSPRFAVPRYANTDTADFAAQVNAVTDAFDNKAGLFLSGLASARPAFGVADRYYYATDTGELSRDSGSAWTTLNPRARTILTALPGAPYDGQEILYRAATGIIWPLVYDATIADAYKWLAVGPSAMQAEVLAVENRNAATYADITTVGPQLVMPLAGEYDFTLEATIEPGGVANNRGWASLAYGATAPVDGDALVVTTPAASTVLDVSESRTMRRTITAAATTVKMQYKSTGTNNMTFYNRHLQARPVRVG